MFLGGNLAQFHDELLRDGKSKNKLGGKARLKKLIPAIVNFIDNIDFNLNDSELLANAVLGSDSDPNVRVQFIKCMKHYQSLVGASQTTGSESKTETTDSKNGVRQKIYAVPLEVRDSSASGVDVTEWVSGKNVNPEVPVSILPIALPWLVPPLHDLWTMAAAEADSTRPMSRIVALYSSSVRRQ